MSERHIDRHAEEFCAAHGCPKAAIWASPIRAGGATFLVPVCREHGTPLSPIHGVVSLGNFMRRKPAEAVHAE